MFTCALGVQGAYEEDDFGQAAGAEPSFSVNLRPPAIRSGAATHDFKPESEEEVLLLAAVPLSIYLHISCLTRWNAEMLDWTVAADLD